MIARRPIHELAAREVVHELLMEFDAVDGEGLFDAAARIVSTRRRSTQVRLAAHAVLDTPRVYGIWMRGLRRALRFAQTTSQPPRVTR